MNILQVKDKHELSEQAARRIISLVRKKPDATLGLATGNTPEETYRLLIHDHRTNHTSYRKVRTVNLDEYVGLDRDHPNSYHRYMNDHLFQYLDIQEAHGLIPDGQAPDLDAACRRYDERIKELGGIDLQLLGIGRNGHIGFNEPGTPFTSSTHVVRLTDSTRRANARYFNKMEEVPDRAITMGIGTILKSREILLLASGEGKAEAINHLLSLDEPDTDLPASALKRHPNVTVIADRAALSEFFSERRNSR